MAKTPAGATAEKVALYDQLIATVPGVERKGATMPYTSVNGHMFSFLTTTGTLALRLPAKEREVFLKKYKTKLCQQHGVVMQEYVDVPDALLKKPRTLKKYFETSHAYVSSLKPKSTVKSSPHSKKPRK